MKCIVPRIWASLRPVTVFVQTLLSISRKCQDHFRANRPLASWTGFFYPLLIQTIHNDNDLERQCQTIRSGTRPIASAWTTGDDIGHFGLGHGYILARPKLVDPPGECLPDIQIVNELGLRLTPKEYWFADHRELLNEVLRPSGFDFEGFAELGMLKGADRFFNYLDFGFKTPSNKVELTLTRAKELGVAALPDWQGPPEAEDPDYPLCLTSSKSPFYLHSSYRWLKPLRDKEPAPRVLIHPDTAQEFKIMDQELVLIETRQGSIVQQAALTDRVLPKVVHASPGWWFPEDNKQFLFGWDQSNYNLLTRADRVGSEFGTPNLKGLNCRIRPAPPSEPAGEPPRPH